jgi:hypothetical protein
MNNICFNCRYWTKVGYFGKDVYGQCGCEKFVYNDGTLESLNTDELHYWDIESYNACFETGKDFGCIHWEKRNEI